MVTVDTQGKEYNCPDCEVRENTCKGCQRYVSRKTNNKDDIINEKCLDTNKSYMFVYPTYGKYNPCAGCSNNPRNGGSGICHCILGNNVTYATSVNDTDTIVVTPNNNTTSSWYINDTTED